MGSIPTPKLSCEADTDKRRRRRRRKEYRLLDRIQGKLERRWRTPIFNDDQLAEVCVTRGAPFDIDNDDPLDFDPRYFLPGTEEDVDRGMELSRQDPTIPRDNIEWYLHQPIQCHRIRQGTLRYFESCKDNRVREGEYHDTFFHKNTINITGWEKHWQVNTDKAPYFWRSWESPDNGEPCAHVIRSGRYFWWRKPGLEPWEFNSDVPHAMATVSDSEVPRNGGLLRSELLVAVRLIKSQIAHLNVYIDHRVCPGLIISFHGRFSARVVQVSIENGVFTVRPSRLLNLHVTDITPDVRLALRWYNCLPVGDTRYPISTVENLDPDDGSEEIEITSLKIVDGQAA
ncbi:hypothetical protein B0I35DRAFT_47676 [Stachybotrys elegans]|uniref:Uncharacterized protein n=1 Tax=Stachybotrys elegans TaxID=80388 RepID=A0A8K0T358_9HYPO|nr:hypothetical protein B0I35DRAFT_47676 [Stachybotrys elegans]